MRVRLGRVRGDERGAVLIIVTLMLLVFIGFSALVIDVGGLLVARRRMVRAADAAALAAAQDCAKGNSLDDAETQADDYASANQAAKKADSVTGGIYDSDGCAEQSGFVSVEYKIDEELYFAPILGLNDTEDVFAHATAIWGKSGVGNPLPIMVSEEWYDFACPLEDQPVGTTITCLWDNDTANTNAFWGGLDLDEWNVPETYNCGHELDDPGPDEAAQQKNEVGQGGVDEDLAINTPPDPTWVCVTQGVKEDVVIALDDYAEAHPNNILFFPIVRPPHLLESNGKVEKVNIVGFVKVRVIEAHQPQALIPISQTCQGKYESPVTKGTTLKLDDFTIINPADCSAYIPPFTKVELKMVKEWKNGAPKGPNLLNSQGTISPNPCCSPTERSFTYAGDPTLAGAYVQFNFTKPAALEDCGGHAPTNSSAWCITFQWLGNQFTQGGTIECPVDVICPGNVISIRLDE